MAFNIWIFIVKCLFCIGFIVANVEAMTGENVQDVETGEFPYIVSIIKTPSTRHYQSRHVCTGTLVSRKDVMTIGHCIEDQRISRIRILIGSISLNDGLRFYPLWWRLHNDWAARRNFPPNSIIDDIGMIRLTQSVPDDIDHATLWYIPRRDLIDSDVVTAGWGSSEPYSVNNTMKKISVDILSDNAAKDRVVQMLGHEIIMDPKLLYTASNEHSLLQSGDSGGPLLQEDRLIGVNIGTVPIQARNVDPQTGTTPLESRHPLTMNIHFNVLEFRRFIEEFISEQI